MNLNLFKLSAAALLLVIINGCKKNDQPVNLQGVYQISNTFNLSAPVMYTSKGKVTDQSIIAAYINKHTFLTVNGYSYFVLNANTTPSDMGSGIFINFQDENNATLTSPGNDTTYVDKFTVTDKTGSAFVLEAVATGVATSYDNQQKVETLLANSNSINMVSNCRSFLFDSSYEDVCTFRQAYPFAIKNGHIYMQLYNCSITSYINSTTHGYVARGDMPGIFNEGVATQLDATDTLVYQAKTILFNKQ